MSNESHANSQPEQSSRTSKADLKVFVERFCETTATTHKKDLLADFLTRNPAMKSTKIIDAVSGLSDRKRCIEYIAACKGKLSIIENLTLSRRLASANREIDKRAKAIFNRMTAKDRKGRKFDEIVMGNISPLIKHNESQVLENVLQRINKLKGGSPITNIYSSFISDLIQALNIVQRIKNNGITEISIEEEFTQSRSKLMKPGMRTILQNVLFMDPRFALFKHKIQELLHSFRSEELEKEAESGRILNQDQALKDLSDVKDLETFLDKASAIIESGSGYINHVAKLFDFRLHNPLLSIYKILKFPIDRELFWKWMQKAPVPTKLLPEIKAEVISLKNELEKDSQTKKPPTSYEDLLKLIYDYKGCFTDKYKLITEASKTHPEKQALNFCLDQIKNVYYKIENKILTLVINQLQFCFSYSEIEKILLEDKKKISQRIKGYKLKLKKNIDSLMQGGEQEKYKVLPSVLKYAVEEKVITEEAFLQIDRQVNPEHELGFIVRLASSLLGFYFLLNCKLIIDLWRRYFASLKVSDGVFLRHKLSSLTKEEIYELCTHYAKEKPVVIENLKKYLDWGKAEKQVRLHMLERLGKPESFAPEITSGKYRLIGDKYSSTMTVKILDAEKKVRFHNKSPGVNTFLDFLNIIKKNKIHNLINVSDEQLKVLFQNIHLHAIDDLSRYIEERLKLLTSENSLVSLSAKEIELNYAKQDDPAKYIEDLLKSGEAERVLRNTLSGRLDQELKTTPVQETDILERIKAEIQNQNTALEHIETMIRFIRALETKQGGVKKITDISIDEINKYLKLHRVEKNAAYLETILDTLMELEAGKDTGGDLIKTKEYVRQIPKPEVFTGEDSVYEGKYESLDQAKAGIRDTILVNSIEDNLSFLDELLKIGNNELAARTAYVKDHSAYKRGSAQFFVYARELDEQQALTKKIKSFLEFVSNEFEKLQEVKKLNDAAALRFKQIAEKMRGKQPDEQSRLLAEDLYQLTDQEQKLGVAANFLVNSTNEDVLEKTKEIINSGSVNRYKILISLYNILDQQQDHDAKIKILDEFCSYLEENRYELYVQLKDLLDTQRKNLLNQYTKKRARISDLWRVLETQQSRENKIQYLNELLADSEWSMFYSYVENIKQGLLAENVDDMLTRNKHLALEDQYDLLQKIKMFRAEEYDTPEINERLSRKLLELSARQGVLKDKKTKIISSQGFSFIMRIPANEEKIIKTINSSLFNEERAAVEKEFKAQGIAPHEIKQYITKNLRSETDVSTFVSRKQKQTGQKPAPVAAVTRADAPGTHAERAAARDAAQEQKKQETTRHAAAPPVKKEQAVTPPVAEKQAATSPVKERQTQTLQPEIKAKEVRTKNKDQTIQPEITDKAAAPDIKDLAQAQEFFGPAHSGEEQDLVSKIQKLVHDNKIQEAVSTIQNEVVWEKGKSGELDKMSRLLYSVHESPVIRKHEEVNDFLEKQLQTLSAVIINHAQKKAGQAPSRQAVPQAQNGEDPDREHQAVKTKETEAVARVEEKAKQDLRTLVMSLEGLRDFTDLHTFASQRDFEEEEEKRLARIMNQLMDKGNFIYLEKAQLLLGGGRLKSLIETAFDQHSTGKPVTIDPNLLKKAWDFIRERGNIQNQLRLIGVSSQEERSDLFKELEKLMHPHGVPVHKLAKQKMFAKGESESQETEAPERKQTEAKALEPERTSHVRSVTREKRRGLFTAKVKPKKKPKAKQPVKKIDYSQTVKNYIHRSYAPVLMDYMKRMYRKKKDFFIPISGRRQYYDIEILRRSIEGILRKDARGKHHADLLHSLKHDEKLFPRIVSELFIEQKTKNGKSYFFPKFLKGEIELS
ncbi:MAG: hypothetical protein JW822_09930 [Spirochaetales bacterium]|nr:hypothetical protein [Spirochaetales bacterium]